MMLDTISERFIEIRSRRSVDIETFGGYEVLIHLLFFDVEVVVPLRAEVNQNN